MEHQNTTSGSTSSARVQAGWHRMVQLRPAIAAAMLAALALIPALHPSALAQGGTKYDNVLYPKPIPIPLWAGFEGGYGRWSDKGSFSISDGATTCASFNDGVGYGITAGAKAMIYFNRWIFLSPRIRYEPRPVTFTTSLPGTPVRGANDSIITLQEEGYVDARFAALTGELTVGVELFGTGLYLIGGGGASYMLGGRYDYSEQIIGPQPYTYNDTRSAGHELLSDVPFSTYQGFAFDVRGGGGFLLRIGRLAFNPEVIVNHPLTSILDRPEEMKQTGLLGTFSIMYNIGD